MPRFQFIKQGAEDRATGGAQRVAHGDRAAVDVDLAGIDGHVLDEFQHHRSKRFVDLEQIDVLHPQSGLGQRFAGRRRRAGEHDGRVGTGDGRGNDTRAWLQPQRAALGFGADEHQRRTVDNSGTVARRVHMVDPLDMAVDPQRRGVKAHLPDHFETWLELAQAFEGRFGADELVVIKQDDAVLILHRHQRLVERAVGPRSCGFLLRVQRVGIDVLPAEAFKGGDQIGADPLRGEMAVQVGLRVQRPGAAIAAHWHPRHRLDAANHHQILEARAHFHRAKIHRFQTRSAETIDLHTGDADVPVGHLHRRLGDVRALIANRRDAAEDDIIDLTGVQRGARLQGAQQTGHQVDRLHAVQRAIGLAFATRGAQRIENQSFSHDVLEPDLLSLHFRPAPTGKQ